ncbi:MAG: sodium:proton antiporter [Clostridiales bacterium]|jgi:hydrogenase-4 component B|nr:sodium:proton antiporter [Clostridiales bacterium]
MEFSGNFGLMILVFWPIVAAFGCYLLGRKSKAVRNWFSIFVVFTTFLGMAAMSLLGDNQNPPYFQWQAFMGFRIYFVLDGFRAVYGVITAFMWLATTIFAREYFAHYRNRNRYHFFSLLTFGATLGVFFSADLITTFLFFEIMSMASYVLVIHDEKRKTIKAAQTYMAVAVIGGLALLFGIFILQSQLGTTEIAALNQAMQGYQGNMSVIYMAAAFMLVGFGGKAGMYPLHIWLPNAHPVAPAPASALLSGILTKTGIFGIIIVATQLFGGQFGFSFVLLNIGIVGMFTGAMLALFSTDLKRTLAYSSVSQIGFIILGIGMTGIISTYYDSLAIHGTILHMVNHSMIKLLLFMLAGVVMMNVHELDLNKIRGFGRGKPLFTFCFLMGVLAIIGLPLWNGYISKTLLHDSLLYHIWAFDDNTAMSAYFQLAEGIFTLTGGLTTAYMIKLFICICIEKNRYAQNSLSKMNKKYLGRFSAAVMALCAVIMPVLGFLPHGAMTPISTFGQNFMGRYYPPYHLDFFALLPLRGAAVSLLIGAIIYILIVRICLMSRDKNGATIYIDVWPKGLDIEMKVYRPLLLQILPFLGALFARIVSSALPALASRLFVGYTAFRQFWISENAQDKEQASFIPLGSLMQKSSETREPVVDNVKRKYASATSGEPIGNVAKIANLLNMRFSGDFLRIIFGSLAYSLLIFFIGFAIVQIFVFV